MPEGPFGLNRPLAKEQIMFLITEDSVIADYGIRGPLGGPRPFAKPNPLSEEELQEIASETNKTTKEIKDQIERKMK